MMANPHAAPDQTLGLLLAADLQDHLLSASNDLDRLQTLLSDACDILATSFFGARSQLDSLTDAEHEAARELIGQHLVQAITALQFQDMASQLIVHTNKRLRNCADRLALDAFADDGEGEAVVEAAPLRPNPVTQDEMDAGSVDLF